MLKKTSALHPLWETERPLSVTVIVRLSRHCLLYLRGQDLNLRPSAYEADKLTRLLYPSISLLYRIIFHFLILFSRKIIKLNRIIKESNHQPCGWQSFQGSLGTFPAIIQWGDSLNSLRTQPNLSPERMRHLSSPKTNRNSLNR